jgi:hypothetical protein
LGVVVLPIPTRPPPRPPPSPPPHGQFRLGRFLLGRFLLGRPFHQDRWLAPLLKC